MNIEPLQDNVLIKVPEILTEKKTESGIIIAQDKGDETNKNRGVIEAVGEKVGNLKQGDNILYEKWGGTVFEFEGRRFILINAKAILAKII